VSKWPGGRRKEGLDKVLNAINREKSTHLKAKLIKYIQLSNFIPLGARCRGRSSCVTKRHDVDGARLA
jgi:hypothetical protein